MRYLARDFCVFYFISDVLLTAAKSVSEGRLGCCVTGLLKLLPMALMVMPGMMARFFMMQTGITDIDGQGASVDVCDQAYPFLIRRLLTVIFAIMIKIL